MRRLLQRWHGVMVIYHRWALGRHCSHLPAWWIEEVLGGELDETPEALARELERGA